MADKAKQILITKHIPKDAQVIMSILREMGVLDYEPRVINLLLEFVYRYVACVLEDAKIYANHDKKKCIDLEDVKLALRMQLDQSFTCTPPREVLSEAARIRNSVQLSTVKPHCGIRLPQDRYCLSSSNVLVKVPQFIKKGAKHPGQLNATYERIIKPSTKVNLNIFKRAPNNNSNNTNTKSNSNNNNNANNNNNIIISNSNKRIEIQTHNNNIHNIEKKKNNKLPIVARNHSVTISKAGQKISNASTKISAKMKTHVTQNTSQDNIEDSSTNYLKRKRDMQEFDIDM